MVSSIKGIPLALPILIFSIILGEGYYNYLPFTDEETEIYRSVITYPMEKEFTQQENQEPHIQLRCLVTRMVGLTNY